MSPGAMRPRSLVAEARRRLAEWLMFDFALSRRFQAAAVWSLGRLALAFGRTRTALALLTKAHRSGTSERVCAAVEELLRRAAAERPAAANARALRGALIEHPRRVVPAYRTARFIEDPARLLVNRGIVLSSPRDSAKGVLLLKYAYAFPFFLRLFDMRRVLTRYHLVLEPSWSGYCDPDILCYLPVAAPVFVQSSEPRDTAFLEALPERLIPVPTSANWWVDHRVFRPDPRIEKDADIVMVAGWGRYKRHHRFFAALRNLRRRGAVLRVILVGNPRDLRLEDIEALAHDFGVHDQIEFHQGLSHEELMRHLNRAKVHVLWSRREGVNRATVEAMLTGLPVILYEGFNYGHHYPHVNPDTGCYSTDAALPDTLIRVIERHDRFNPRQWILDHMSCQHGTDHLQAVIRRYAEMSGEDWSDELAVKINRSATMCYWEEEDRVRFESDYEFLRSAITR